MSANKTAYNIPIIPNASGQGEEDLVHQTCPAWVLTFLRWEIRDTLRTNPTNGLTSQTIAQKPLVVENDCVQVTVSDSKSVLTPSMTASLLITDINYETEIAPGDFVFVNMLNWEHEARAVADKARNRQAINGIHDGFKGFFKVQSVRKSLMVDPVSGTKRYVIRITGFAFTEFNNSIYFNPYLIGESDQNTLLFSSLIGIDWALLQNDKGLTQIQNVLQFLIQSFIGNGFTDLGKKTPGIITANTHFYMPQGVGTLLGLQGLQSAKDAYNFLFGIQKYSNNSNQTLAQGLNPSDVPQNATATTGRFMFTGSPVEGNTVTKPEYWNQEKAWSILNQFTNSPLNELYTCFRVAPNGSVMPTMVFRQIPFTTDNFVPGSYKVTRFMNLPRWNVDPALAFSFDLGKDEVARINFVQYFGKSVNGSSGYDISDENAEHNYLYDVDDVQRNGLRPYVVTSAFDRVSANDTDAVLAQNPGSFRSPGWAKIVGDALIGGHLKMSGSITFVGLPEPIAVGDNLQFDNVVYHIEQISHTAAISQDGKKVFRTTLTLSNGMDLANGQNVVYNEMTYGNAYDDRTADYKSTQILPGVSEAQDVEYRPTTPDPTKLPPAGGDSFTEPNTNTSINKFQR